MSSNQAQEYQEQIKSRQVNKLLINFGGTLFVLHLLIHKALETQVQPQVIHNKYHPSPNQLQSKHHLVDPSNRIWNKYLILMGIELNEKNSALGKMRQWFKKYK